MRLDQSRTISDTNGLLWTVPIGGCRWIEGVPDPDPDHPERFDAAQQPLLVDPRGGPSRSYDVLAAENSGLFRTFAETPPTPDGVLGFADRYGMLGVPQNASSPGFGGEGWNRGRGRGETLNNWLRHVEDMRRAVELLDLIRSADHRELGRHVFWLDGLIEHGLSASPPSWWYDSHPGAAQPLSNPGTTGSRPEPLRCMLIGSSGLCRDDPTPAARRLLQTWVNDHLRGEVLCELQFDPKTEELHLRGTPKNLLTALWLQLAVAVAENKRHSKCKACGKWFEVAGAGRRSHSVFCSGACTSRDYRRNKEEAVRLHAEGLTDREVARRLGRSVTSVRGWIRAGRGRG